MSSQNNQNNNYNTFNQTSLNQYKDDLKVFQEAQLSAEKTMKDNSTQTVNWFEQLCGVQNILSIEHAQACYKFKEFLNEQANKTNNNNIEQKQQQVQPNQPIQLNTNANNQVTNPFSQPFQSTNSQFNNTNQNQPNYHNHPHSHSVGYYIMCGFGVLIALKMTKRLIFGRSCHSKWQHWCHHHYNYSQQNGHPQYSRWYSFCKQK